MWIKRVATGMVATASLVLLSTQALAVQEPPASGDWPASWNAMRCGATVATDLVNDSTGANATFKDIVGTTDFPAAYYATSENYLFLRMRVGATPMTGQSRLDASASWAFGFDTNGSLSEYEWVWSLNGGNSADLRLYPNGSSSAVTTYSVPYSATTWFRTSVAGTTLGSQTNYFVDIAIPVVDFATVSAANATGSLPEFQPGMLTMWAATSASPNTLNKDMMCWNDATPVTDLSAIAPAPIGIGGYAVISSPTAGGTVNSNTTTISGTATASSSFTISDGTSTATVNSDANGDWTFDIPSGWNLTYGNSHTISVSKAGWTGDSKTFTIACAAGYVTSANSLSCDDVDECVTANGGCDANATCTNTAGSRTCQCNAGYAGDGLACVNPMATTVSITSPPDGSTLNTITPVISGTATASTSITLVNGTNTTTITSGADGNWSFNVPSGWGLLFGSASVSFQASVGSGVTSTITVSIQCLAGTVPSGTGTSCVDINECLTDNGGCSINATCTNAATSNVAPACACNAHYTGDGITCNPVVDLTAPVSGSDLTTVTPTVSGTATPGVSVTITLGLNSTTVTSANPGGTWSFNVPAGWGLVFGSSYTFTASVTGGATSSTTINTVCASGYELDGSTCADINECATANGGCNANATCTQSVTPGNAPSCACNAGYTGNGYSCSAGAVDSVTITAPSNGAQWTTLTPVISGTATPSQTISLVIGSGNTINVAVDANGDWTYQVQVGDGLVYGETYSISATYGSASATSSASTVCSAGHQASGTSCVDINECATANGGCHAHATCTENTTPGNAPSCACNSGYTGNGITCTLVPVAPVISISSPATGATIHTITPVISGTGDPNTTFTVSGGAGHDATVTTDGSGNWTYTVPTSWNWRYDTSVTFSTAVTGGAPSQVLLTLQCATGFETDDGAASCSDIDECAAGTAICAANRVCNNTAGAYTCQVVPPTPTPTPTPTPVVNIDTSSEETHNFGPDTDGDGIADASDNCIFIKNPGQEASAVSGVGKACDFGDGNAAVEAQKSSGLKAEGGGCTAKVGGNNGVGHLLFGYLFFFSGRRMWRRRKKS